MSFKFGVNLTDKVTVNTAGKAHINDLSEFTAAAWIMPTAVGAAANGNVFCKSNGGGTQCKWFFQIPSTMNMRLQVRRAGGLAFLDTSAAIRSLELNKWNFVAAVFSASQSLMKIYLGTETKPVMDASGSPTLSSGALNADAAFPIEWGGCFVTANTAYIGNLAAVGYWNRAMPLNELQQLQFAFNPLRPGCVDFHEFNSTLRVERTPDLTPDQKGTYGVLSSTSLLIAPSPKLPWEPGVNIY
jgi:Concanavalin A-like lectin/glucanases superfamily